MKEIIILIYIPIWFYINAFSCNRMHIWDYIYIPIWFYINFESGITMWHLEKFTFQYGSILTNMIILSWMKKDLIYIPIWFYINPSIYILLYCLFVTYSFVDLSFATYKSNLYNIIITLNSFLSRNIARIVYPYDFLHYIKSTIYKTT